MTTKKSVPIHLRLNKKPTAWLRELPPGEYCIKELEELTHKSASTIKQRLNLLKIPKKYDATSGYPLVVYLWVGIKKYEKTNKYEKVKKLPSVIINKKYKSSNTPPSWLRELISGEYDLKELQKITKRSANTIKQKLCVLRIPKKYKPIPGCLLSIVYVWVGIAAYENSIKNNNN